MFMLHRRNLFKVATHANRVNNSRALIFFGATDVAMWHMLRGGAGDTNKLLSC